MSIGNLLRLAQKEGLRADLEVLLAHLLKWNRLDLLARSEEEVPVELLAGLQLDWARVKQGYPVAYLTHQKEFYGLNFYVDDRVLVPRGETELLVDLLLERASGRVLELGTGSGAISAALKVTNPALNLTATDLSSDALEVANKNFVQLSAEVRVLESDLLEKVPHEKFQVLVANLPYIGEKKHDFIADNVKNFEPHVALFGGEDGLQLYSRLFDQIRDGNWDFEFILGEIGFSQGPDLVELVKRKLPNYDVQVRKDLQGLDRHFILERSHAKSND